MSELRAALEELRQSKERLERQAPIFELEKSRGFEWKSPTGKPRERRRSLRNIAKKFCVLCQASMPPLPFSFEDECSDHIRKYFCS